MTKKFEIIKGTEADFEGAPEDAMVLARLNKYDPDFATGIGYGEFFYDDLSGERIEMRAPQDWTLIAERRPIDEPQPDADGWIDWKGGDFPPVEKGVKIDRKYRDGYVASNVGCGSDCIWSHSGSAEDIIAYRLSKPEQAEQPESPVTWDGKGLPPVGVECEVSVANATGKCKIVYISETYAVFINNGSEACFNTYLCTFRPIRSPESIEREKAIQEMRDVGLNLPAAIKFTTEEMAALYDAGYRKVGK